tara:strand:- start:511 stop:684 length:174 start_codon:yes stop_codon:yes gene_type:complete
VNRNSKENNSQRKKFSGWHGFSKNLGEKLNVKSKKYKTDSCEIRTRALADQRLKLAP